jgi:hypothetical protein
LPIDDPDRGERGLGIEAHSLGEADAERRTVLSRDAKLMIELLDDPVDPIDGDTQFPDLGPNLSEIAPVSRRSNALRTRTL